MNFPLMKKALLFFFAGLPAVFAYSQSPDSMMIKKIVDETMTNATAYNNLRKICKEVGPRLSGSAEYRKAVQLTKIMLGDLGVDTVYLQPCMTKHWERGAKEEGYIAMAGGEKFPMHLTALGNSVATPSEGINGSVIEVTSMAELEALGRDVVKGNIVFFNFKMNRSIIEAFNAYGESGISRKDGPAQAAKFGATAAIVRSLSMTLNDYPHTGATKYNDSFPKIPAIAISTNDAEWLSRQLKRKMVTKAWFKINCKILPDSKDFNVIGEIKGTDCPNEIITVGGHLDSWDLAEGANDDGSGVVQSMEVLRNFIALGIKPKKTIRAVLFANEENGTSGGDAYFQAAKKNNEHHIFALESDAGGFTPRGFSFAVTDKQWEKVVPWKELFYNYGVYKFVRGESGSDIESLNKIGAALAGLLPDSQRYFYIHHAATDTFENVNERELHLGAANMAALIYLVSEYGL